MDILSVCNCASIELSRAFSLQKRRANLALDIETFCLPRSQASSQVSGNVRDALLHEIGRSHCTSCAFETAIVRGRGRMQTKAQLERWKKGPKIQQRSHEFVKATMRTHHVIATGPRIRAFTCSANCVLVTSWPVVSMPFSYRQSGTFIEPAMRPRANSWGVLRRCLGNVQSDLKNENSYCRSEPTWKTAVQTCNRSVQQRSRQAATLLVMVRVQEFPFNCYCRDLGFFNGLMFESQLKARLQSKTVLTDFCVQPARFC